MSWSVNRVVVYPKPYFSLRLDLMLKSKRVSKFHLSLVSRVIYPIPTIEFQFLNRVGDSRKFIHEDVRNTLQPHKICRATVQIAQSLDERDHLTRLTFQPI